MTHPGTQMPSGGGHTIKALHRPNRFALSAIRTTFALAVAAALRTAAGACTAPRPIASPVVSAPIRALPCTPEVFTSPRSTPADPLTIAGAAATITDFTKGETIKFVSNANANFASSKVTLIAEATFDNYVTEAAKAADAVSGGTHGIAWFQFGGNTFIVQDIDGDAAFTNGADSIVKLTGLVDLSASSFNEVGQGTLLFI